MFIVKLRCLPYCDSIINNKCIYLCHDDLADLQGLRLVHLMMVAAEATIGVNNNHDMVTSYGDIDSTQLVGVSDLWKQRGEARSLSYTRCLEGLVSPIIAPQLSNLS
ncbi:hypothetical protein K1719_005461 [Acacia pycnantha]|nr:hypothetical protein K1719_005461 [Acacia pycnantha]